MAKKKTTKSPAKKSATRKTAAKKATPRRRTPPKAPTFPPSSERTIYEVPLNLIVDNPGNPGAFREQEVIPALYEQGYRVFPTAGVDDDHTLWTMLNGKPGRKPNEALRATAVHLITEFEDRGDEDSLVTLAGSIESVTLLHPVHVIVQKGKVGLESGMVRALALSYSYARRNLAPATIDAEVAAVDGDLKEMLARAAISNLHVIANQPMALAHRYRLMADGGMGVGDIANRIRRTEQTVRNYLDLTEHPEHVQQAIANGDLTMQLALDMSKQAREEERPLADIVAETLGDEGEEDGGDSGGGLVGGRRRRRGVGASGRRKALPWQKVFLLYVEEASGKLDRTALEKLTKGDVIDHLFKSQAHLLDLLRQIMQVEEDEAKRLVAEHFTESIDLEEVDLGLDGIGD